MNFAAYKPHGMKTVSLDELEGDLCDTCGKAFEPKSCAHRFCCVPCRTIARRLRDRERYREQSRVLNANCCCPQCGTIFDAHHRAQKYCGEACQKASSRFRHTVTPNRARLKSLVCSRCGETIESAKKSSKKYCGQCEKIRRKETIREYYYRSRSRPVPSGPAVFCGEANGYAKLTEDAVRTIRAKSAQGASSSKLGALHGVDSSTIRLIVSRRSWRHI